MKDIRKALTEMHRRLHLVEAGMTRLNLEVADGHARTDVILQRMDSHWASVSLQLEATRAEAEEMRRHAEEMRKHAEEMRIHAGESNEQVGAMRVQGEAMRIEAARNTAVFDQVTADMVENLQAYQKNVGIVLEFVITKAARHDEEHEELFRRVEALEQKSAG